MMALCLAISTGCLTACAANDPQSVAIVKTKVPLELLTCDELPKPPPRPANNGPRRGSDAGEWLLWYQEVAEDCRRKHGALAALVR